jgi:phosphodiesterase/alkaline phosphatase D-like protein
MVQQIDRFYEKLYIERWSNPEMSLMLASVPSVMMWDDHDIFDGWGSYPEDLQDCDVYQSIFEKAKHYFELCQIRSKKNQSLINASSAHYAFAFSFRQYHILAIDNRSERSLKQVMSPVQWTDLKSELHALNSDGDLFLLTAVPVVYRDFSFTENLTDATPWEEELTDDLKDHWRAKEHQGERAKLIMNLLTNAHQRQGRTVMLSGDIHIGCIGVINDYRQDFSPVKIHQIVSSGIIHPSPSMIEWYGIMAVTNDRDEYLNEDHTIRVSMLKPHGSNQYIRSRNFVTLEEGTDQKLWVNWISEGKDVPVYPLDK